MDENKMFNLLEKIYVEVQEIKKDVKNHTDKFNNVDNRFDGIENEIKKLGARIDGKPIPTKKAVLNVHKDNSEQDEIMKYKELLDDGIITEEEFSIKEKELLLSKKRIK